MQQKYVLNNFAFSASLLKTLRAVQLQCWRGSALLKLFVLSQARNGFFSSLAFLINISSFLTLFTVISIDFLFSVILYWLFVPNCLLRFTPNENVLLAKLALFLNCGVVAFGRLMIFSQSVPSSHPTFSFQTVFAHFMFFSFRATVFLKSQA